MVVTHTARTQHRSSFLAMAAIVLAGLLIGIAAGVTLRVDEMHLVWDESHGMA